MKLREKSHRRIKMAPRTRINQACSGPSWENIGLWSFLHRPRLPLPVRPSCLVNKIYIRHCTREHNSIRHNTTLQHNTTQYSSTQHNTIQHNTLNTTQYSEHNNTIQHITQHNTIQHNKTQYNTTQYNTTTITIFKQGVHFTKSDIQWGPVKQ